jgi:hypothetical protein
MERMIQGKQYDSLLWESLARNGLTDLSQFHSADFFDEVPLFTRESDVAFLAKRPGARNRVLLSFALKYLRSVVAYEQHHRPFYAAITVWKFSTKESLTPNLFMYLQSIDALEEVLLLHPVTTPFGRKMETLVGSLPLSGQFEVFEDTSTVAGFPRVFVGPSEPFSDQHLPLRRLCRSASSARRN